MEMLPVLSKTARWAIGPQAGAPGRALTILRDLGTRFQQEPLSCSGTPPPRWDNWEHRAHRRDVSPIAQPFPVPWTARWVNGQHGLAAPGHAAVAISTARGQWCVPT